MGFPVGYAEVFFPNPFLHTLAFLGLLRNLVFFLFHLLGLSDFLENDVAWPEPRLSDAAADKPPSLSAFLIRDLLPVAVFRDSDVAGHESACACAVCLLEFSQEDEIRCMRNCKHIFHRTCVDRWIDHDQKTCPLCRSPFVPHDMLDDYNQRLLSASGVNDFYADYTSSF